LGSGIRRRYPDVVTPEEEAGALIELTQAASFLTLFHASGEPWDKQFGEIVPGDLEKDCYRLTRQLGLKPLIDLDNVPVTQSEWRRQLRNERQRDIYDMGNLLARQHAIVGYLQCHPDVPQRPEACFTLDQIGQSLRILFRRYNLTESLAKLPVIPLPGAPDSWMIWSGDALRHSVLRELGAPED
jgi:hypothetical protein